MAKITEVKKTGTVTTRTSGWNNGQQLSIQQAIEMARGNWLVGVIVGCANNRAGTQLHIDRAGTEPGLYCGGLGRSPK